MKVKEIPVSVYHSLLLRYFFKPRKKVINIPLIVSLTSIPSRLATLDIVISSLLNQDSQPQIIYLWLNHSLINKVPSRLQKLQGERFKIKYCDGTSSYRKLLPSLKENPDTTIVTCDDDVIYPSNWLQSLHRAHLENPNMVITQVGRVISKNEDGHLKSYKDWKFINTVHTCKNLLPIGFGGVLYPPNILSNQVFNNDLYMKLCPNADDLWFKVMAYLNGKSAFCASEQAKPIPILRSQKKSLGKTNIHKNGNYEQWLSLCDYFPELKKLG